MSATDDEARVRYFRTMRAELQRQPAARALLAAVLDRRDRRGRLPKTFLYAPRDAASARAAAQLLPAESLRRRDDGKLRVDLARLDTLVRENTSLPLDEFLGLLLDRDLRDLPAEEGYRRQHLASLITESLGNHPAKDPELATWRDDELARASRGVGDLALLARRQTPAEIRSTVLDLGHALLAARKVMRNGDTVRLANFSRTVAGNTKRFAFGTEMHALLDAAIASFVPRDDTAPRGPGAALEAAGIVTNETAIDVLAYLPANLVKGGRRHTWPRDAHRMGEAVRLTLQNLRAACLECALDTVVTIENETTFNDARESLHAKPSATALVATAGHPNRAVTLLLQLLAAASPQARFHHWGDLDLAGLFILATLRRRTGLGIAPLLMDAATVARHRGRGRELAPDGLARLEDTIARRRLPEDLLPIAEAIRKAGVCIEQEAIADAMPDLAAALLGRA